MDVAVCAPAVPSLNEQQLGMKGVARGRGRASWWFASYAMSSWREKSARPSGCAAVMPE